MALHSRLHLSLPSSFAAEPSRPGGAAARRLSRRPLRPSATTAAVALLLGGLQGLAQAQAQTANASSGQLPRVTVEATATAAPGPQVGGFSPEPLARTPLTATVVDLTALRDRGLNRIADLTRVDASLGDAYNAPGYWDSLTVRGFVLDNRSNFRRDGLPISGETALPLDNKQRLEVLKGLAGIQAGSAAPGGLVNLVVKRPLAEDRSQYTLQAESAGSVLAAADLSRRFGEGGAFGLRLNAAAERLDPPARSAQGERGLLALAGEWRPSAGTRLELEGEWSRRSQPSVPGFSLLGSRVPGPADPRINLNNQPWSQPVVFEGSTGSLRFTQALGADWRFKAHAAVQDLSTDDRLAFPYGCSAENVFDRYCSDGRFDLYDYRSEGERRRSTALDFSLDGRFSTGSLRHDTTLGVLRASYRQRLNRQAYNYVGEGDITGTVVTPADPALTDENTQRDDRSTELYWRHRVAFNPATQAWLGLRHTQLDRASVRTDGSRPTQYEQRYTTPWLALTQQISPTLLAYASWGEGVESDVVPGRSRYTNAGQGLPVSPSQQWELGLKGEGSATSASAASWGVALFDIRRPLFTDFGACDSTPGSCTRSRDGEARHRGLAVDGSQRLGALTLAASLQALQARRQGASDTTLNGLPPPNVPERSLKAEARWAVASVPGLVTLLGVSADSSRSAVADNSLRIGGSARWDAAAVWNRTTAAADLTWRAGIDNLADRRAWRESPVQFGHSYLYPMAPRTFRVSLVVTPK